jgi:diguanylate cyclase (GGDEF)-like protein
VTRPDPRRLDDLRTLVPEVQAALSGLSGEVGRLQAELAEARARLAEAERMADRDPLTGLLNRRGFGRELRRAAAALARYGEPATILYLDMNGFKAVNDTLGHAGGDAALLHVARLLEANIRPTDAGARLGGDEFAVLLIRAPEAVARAKARQLQQLVSDTPFAYAGRPARLAVAIGVRPIMQPASTPRPPSPKPTAPCTPTRPPPAAPTSAGA